MNCSGGFLPGHGCEAVHLPRFKLNRPLQADGKQRVRENRMRLGVHVQRILIAEAGGVGHEPAFVHLMGQGVGAGADDG